TREWLYTAITRAAGRCVILYTRDGIGNAIGKQTIKGKTLADKVRSFQELQKVGIAGAAVTVKMPLKKSLVPATTIEAKVNDSLIVDETAAEVTERVIEKVVERVVLRDRTIIIEKESNNEPSKESATVDGGEITPKQEVLDCDESVVAAGNSPALLERSPRFAKRAATLGAIRVMQIHQRLAEQRLLTYDGNAKPGPDQSVKPKGLWALMQAKKAKQEESK